MTQIAQNPNGLQKKLNLMITYEVIPLQRKPQRVKLCLGVGYYKTFTKYIDSYLGILEKAKALGAIRIDEANLMKKIQLDAKKQIKYVP